MLQPPRRRPARHALLALAIVAALVTGLLAGTTSTASADPRRTPQPASSGPGPAPKAQSVREGAAVHYGVPTPNCATPAPGHRACLSERIEPATADTPGAIAFTAPMAANAGPSGYGYTPAALAAAYGYDPDATAGATQTVAVVDAYDDPAVAADLGQFDKQYGLPAETATSFRKVDQNGQAAPLPVEDDGWAGEIALDVEAVRAVCHRCRILLVEADSEQSADLDAAVDTAARLGATEISNSYGSAEAENGRSTSSAADLAAYDHPGVVITAAAGDDGWYDWDCANVCSWSQTSSNAPQAPASYPTVVSVGGTMLSLGADGSRASEQVWNENGVADANGLEGGVAGALTSRGAQGASGGGCSLIYPAPAFQAAVKGYASLGCAGKRSSNDIAALADPETGLDIYDSINNSSEPTNWWPEGGTSLASPLIAAMWALAGGAGGVDYPAKSLYGHFAQAPSSFHDVTVGGNGFCGGATLTACEARLASISGGALRNPNAIALDLGPVSTSWVGLLDCGTTRAGAVIAADRQCNAGPGYDGPSGVGTPDGLAAFRPMAPTASVTWPTLIRPGTAASFRVSRFADPVTKPVATYTWTWGDGTITTTKAASATHRYPRAGTYTVSLRAVDQLGHASAPITRRYVAGKRPTVRLRGPRKARRHRRVTFRATATELNTGGRITGYTWRVGARVVGHGSTLRYRFPKKGKKKVRVVVTDSSGLTARSPKHVVRVR